MKNICIYYFSGTGNTRYIVDKISNRLTSYGNNVTIFSCEKSIEFDNSFDMIGVAFPIHTSKAPVIFDKFIKNMPVVNNKKLFGIVTSGYIAGDVLQYYKDTFLALGYDPFLFENFVVGNNLHLPYLSPLKVLNDDKSQVRRLKLDKKIDIVSMQINHCDNSLKGSSTLSKVFGKTQRTLGKWHERTNFKGFYADENCINCEWCIKNCPTGNITIADNILTFHNNCIICMRCYNFCPYEAIQCTKHTKNVKYKRYNGIENLKNSTKFN